MSRVERHRLLTAQNAARLLRYGQLRLRRRGVQGHRFNIDRRSDLRVARTASLVTGRAVSFGPDFTGHFHERSSAVLGSQVWFSRGCTLTVHQSVTIGDNCIFGEYVSIHDENHVMGSDDVPITDRGFRTQPVVIGRNVWVGAKATVLSGVTIGDNAVIAANAVVSRDVEPGVVVGGVPARVIARVDGSPYRTATEVGPPPHG